MPAATLPEGWRTVHLGDVAEVVMGQSPPGDTVHDWDRQTAPNVGLPFAQGNAEFGNRSPTPVKWCIRPAKAALPNDLLISVRAPVGETNRADQPLAIGRGLAAIRFKGADASYGWHILNHAKSAFDRLAQGSTFEAVSGGDIRSLPLLLPPLPEQRAIAAVLDSIDEAIERTDEVIAATERLRDALLHELLTRGLPGHHTAWRDVPGLGTIPADWDVVRLGDCLEGIEAGRSPMCESRPAQGGEWGVLKVSSVSWGAFQSMENKALTDESAIDPRYEVKVGDILLSRANTPDLVGRAVLVRTTPPRLLLSDKTLRLVPDRARMEPKFLLLSLSLPHSRSQISGAASGSSRSMFNVSQERLRSVKVGLPPLPEQQAIAAVLDSIDATIDRARAERAALQSSKASTADALLTGRVRVNTNTGAWR